MFRIINGMIFGAEISGAGFAYDYGFSGFCFALTIAAFFTFFIISLQFLSDNESVQTVNYVRYQPYKRQDSIKLAAVKSIAQKDEQ